MVLNKSIDIIENKEDTTNENQNLFAKGINSV